MASQQFSAAVFNCPMLECTRRATEIPWADPNPLEIENGYMKVSTRPGLGVELDQEYLKANRAEGEPWWD
jgi:galactonate dehydratase